MTKEKRTLRVVMSIDIETTKSIDEVKSALKRGIYRGLDTEPYYVAQPKGIKINYCQEDTTPFDAETAAEIEAYIENGNAIKNPDGTYSTQTAMWRDRLTYDELVAYFKREYLSQTTNNLDMSIKVVKAYKTADERVFNEIEDAIKHQIRLDITGIIEPHMYRGIADADIADIVIENFDAISDVITRHRNIHNLDFDAIPRDFEQMFGGVKKQP